MPLSALILAAAVGAGGASLPQQPGLAKGVRVSEVQRIQVTVENRIRRPGRAGSYKAQVVNRMPAAAPWSGEPSIIASSPTAPTVRDEVGEFAVSFGPKQLPSLQVSPVPSRAWYWNLRETSDAEKTVVCQYVITTARRTFDARSYLHLTLRDLEGIPSSLSSEVNTIKAQLDPRIKQLVEQYVKPDVRLVDLLADASAYCDKQVAWAGEDSAGKRIERFDVKHALDAKRGWCGPRSAVFRSFCIAAGIPAREVSGYALKSLTVTGGEVNMSAARGLPDPKKDGNAHVWAEVYLPEVGWIEINVASQNPFDVPATFIRCTGLEGPWVRYTDTKDRQLDYDPFAARVTVRRV